MDAQLASGLHLAIPTLSLALSAVSLIAAGCAWFFSRAEKIRTFEALVTQHVQDLRRRVESVETKALEQYTALSGVADEAQALFERVNKERKRVTQENARAETRAQTPAGNGLPTRAEQIQAVQAHFGGV